jgi:hypothetical protein
MTVHNLRVRSDETDAVLTHLAPSRRARIAASAGTDRVTDVQAILAAMISIKISVGGQVLFGDRTPR